MTVNRETIELSSSSFFRTLRWKSDVNDVEVFDHADQTFSPLAGAGSLWHAHREMELTLVTSGVGLRIVGDNSTPILPSGDLVLLGGGLPHCWRFDGNSSGICLQWNETTLFEYLTEQARLEMLSLIERSSQGIEFSAVCRAEASVLLQTLAFDLAISETERLGMFLQILGILNRDSQSANQPVSTSRFGANMTQANYSSIQKAISHVMDNFQSEISLEDVLRETCMSKASFSRHMLKCTGQSFSQFLNEVRVSYACQLIHSTEDSISQIALKSGFNNLSNFNRIFRRLRGQSPTQYRTPSAK